MRKYFFFFGTHFYLKNLFSNQQSSANIQIVGHHFGHSSWRLVHDRFGIRHHLFVPNAVHSTMALGRLRQLFYLRCRCR
jgi:hypothetical protein